MRLLRNYIKTCSESSTLRQVVQRARKDNDHFEKCVHVVIVELHKSTKRYMHNAELVELLNCFADRSAPMPDHWQALESADNRVRQQSVIVE